MGRWLDTGQLTLRQKLDIPPIWLGAALALVWGQARLFPVLTESFGVGQLLGVVLACGGIGLAISAVIAFRHHQTSVVPHQVPDTLITNGPFKFSRNPIYLGDVMVLLGAVLWFGAWPSLLIVAGFAALIQCRFIVPEENRLERHFTDAFRCYAQKTRRWI
jgi:protein-S-isoprenylcysteine O-methyltransferase Ste14